MSDEKRTPSTADQVGEAAGGITGAVAGAAIGSSAGPVGTVLGGIAGAIGGWWSGRALAEAAEDITASDDEYYRAHFAQSRDSQREYDDARRAYYAGDVAAANPDYASFDQVETELSRGWNEIGAGEWQAVRGYASVGFSRGRERRRRQRRASREVSGSSGP